ncbi:MAG: PAS domain-containing protein [Balneolaceae bacterium]
MEVSEKPPENLIELSKEIESYFSNHIIAQLFVDADLILRKFTSRAQQQFNLQETDIGKEVEYLSGKIRYENLEKDILEALENNQHSEWEIETEDEKWYQLNITPYAKDQGKVIGVILTFFDITERVEYLEELERLNQEHESFINTISNDLREPLLNVVLHIQEMEDIHKEMSKKMFATMKDITTSVNKMSDFILEVSDFLKKQKKGKEGVKEIDVEEVLEEITLILKKKMKEMGANITTDLKATRIQFPRKKMRSILYTLICNGLKYQVPGREPEIYIKTESADNHMHITVRDNGRGMDEEKQKKLFQKPKKYPMEGDELGVGLCLVKKMVVESGGKIEVISKPDEGTTFYLYIKNQGYDSNEILEIN